MTDWKNSKCDKCVLKKYVSSGKYGGKKYECDHSISYRFNSSHACKHFTDKEEGANE